MARPSYRYLIIFLMSIGFMISFSLRSAFVMTVTHTSQLEEETPVSIGHAHPLPQSIFVVSQNNSAWNESRENYFWGAPPDKVSEIHPGRQESKSQFYRGCTVYNTSRDYESGYSWSQSVQFYSVYYLGMAPGYVVAGYLLSKVDAHHLIAVGFFMTGFLHLLIPVVFTLSGTGVMVIRVLNGFFESSMQPAALVITKSWAFKGEESTFLSMVLLGTYLSPALASFFVGACLCYISWNASLYILAGLLIIWAVLWCGLSYNSPLNCPHISDSDWKRYKEEQSSGLSGFCSKGHKVPWRDILTSKPVWAIWMAVANKNSNLVVVSSLVPLFFKEVYGIRAADSGLLLIAPFLCNSASIVLSSYVSDSLINSGRLSTTAARKWMQCAGALGEATFLICLIYVPGWRLAAVCLTLAQVMTGFCFPGFGCNTMDLSRRFSGAVSGVVFTGILMVFVITGLVSHLPDNEHFNKWTVVFWINAGIAIFSSVFYLVFASGELQPWGDGEETKELNPSKHSSIQVEKEKQEEEEEEKMSMLKG
ncbi:hypothetical protein EGW08_013291 [Elysia chlorotica]|uniref:Major facilitator superfamily (MFS) profile domain-containing protein n=1 Tax=Elysia chlorotica TaxID=188477 RepID=A0A3S0ZHE4_ELYCH|nr:hypothetical protein EGW08_013291 [Elysia chlorotica]